MIVQNGENFSLEKGDLVYVAYADGSTAVVKLTDKTKFLGIVDEEIEPNDTGYITMSGIVNGIDTSITE